MIFHLLYKLQTEFPDLTFVAEGELSSDPQRRIVIQSTGGTTAGYSGRADDTAQIRVYDLDQLRCYNDAKRLHEYLKERFRVVWEPHPVLGSGAGPITIARVAAPNRPQAFGRQEPDGLMLYLFNVVVTWSDKTLDVST
jgi:hypothetical protein